VISPLKSAASPACTVIEYKEYQTTILLYSTRCKMTIIEGQHLKT